MRPAAPPAAAPPAAPPAAACGGGGAVKPPIPAAPPPPPRARPPRFLSPREDRFKLHALLGLYCALHIAYRAAAWLRDGTCGFGPGAASLASVAPHAALALSGLRFHVPRVRSRGAPMLYQEARATSVVFSARSTLLFLLCWLSLRSGRARPWLHLRGAVVLWAMRCADVAAEACGDPRNGTLMRGMPWPAGAPPRLRAAATAFYALSQLVATGASLTAYRLDAHFAVLAVVQVASFCFTLCRKGRLSAGGWHAAYTASLLCAYAVGLFSAPVAVDGARRAREIWLLSAVAAAIAALRATGRAPDKFVLWGALWAGALLAVRCGSLDRIVL